MKKALLLAPMASVHRRFNYANILALRDCGFEVHLAGNFENGDGPESQNDQYVSFCRKQGLIFHPFPFYRHSLFKNLKLIKSVSQLISDNDYSIVHAHTETGGLILRLVGNKNKVRYFYTAHGMSFYKGSSVLSQLVYRPVERSICKCMDMNIAINNEEYAILKKWFPQKAALVHGIGLKFKHDDFTCNRDEIRKSLGIPQEALVVLSVGELDKNKNHSLIIDSFVQFKGQNVFYLICGTGPMTDNLTNKIQELGLDEQVRLLGYRSDIPKILAVSDIFVFPSYHEGLPVALMEAMAAGLPVICSAIRGCVDLIENNHNGFLIDSFDKSKWIDKIRVLIESNDLRNKFAKTARKTIESYSFETVKQELIEIYGMNGIQG